MTLFEALRVVAEVHTGIDGSGWWYIKMGALPEITTPHESYVKAWEVIRREAMLPCLEPTPKQEERGEKS